MNSNETHRRGDGWVDHLQNAIDRGFPSGRIDSRTLAEHWDEIFQDAEAEQDNCDDCEWAASHEMTIHLMERADNSYHGGP